MPRLFSQTLQSRISPKDDVSDKAGQCVAFSQELLTLNWKMLDFELIDIELQIYLKQQITILEKTMFFTNARHPHPYLHLQPFALLTS